MSLSQQFEEIKVMLGNYPMVGAVLSIGQVLLGYFIGGNIQLSLELPLIVMQIAQWGAWMGAFGVSTLTIVFTLKKNTKLLDNWKFMKKWGKD